MPTAGHKCIKNCIFIYFHGKIASKFALTMIQCECIKSTLRTTKYVLSSVDELNVDVKKELGHNFLHIKNDARIEWETMNLSALKCIMACDAHGRRHWNFPPILLINWTKISIKRATVTSILPRFDRCRGHQKSRLSRNKLSCYRNSDFRVDWNPAKCNQN